MLLNWIGGTLANKEIQTGDLSERNKTVKIFNDMFLSGNGELKTANGH